MILLPERTGSSRRGSPSFGVQDVLPLGFLAEIQSPVSLASSLVHSFQSPVLRPKEIVVSISQTGIRALVGFGVKDVLTLGFLSEIQSPVSLASSRDGCLAFLSKVSCGTSSPQAFTVMYTCCVMFNGLGPDRLAVVSPYAAVIRNSLLHHSSLPWDFLTKAPAS